MLMIADELWQSITKYKKQLMCGSCMMKRLEALNDYFVIHGKKWNY